MGETIGKIDGIEAATVSIAEVEKTVCVTLDLAADTSISPNQEQAIHKFVAATIENPADYTITIDA